MQRFITPAPFSKFYLEIDNESPGKIGQWLGWQIVRAHVQKYPNKSPQEIITLPAKELFIAANYKPKKTMNKGKETHIKIDVQLDENKVPEKIVWSAQMVA